MNIIFEKEYTDESLPDLEVDLMDYLNDADLPKDENGFTKGTYKVTITLEE